MSMLGVDFGTSGIKIGYWDGNTDHYAELIPISEQDDVFIYQHSPNDSENIKLDILNKYDSADTATRDHLKQKAITCLKDALKNAKNYFRQQGITEIELCRFSISSDNIVYDDKKKQFWQDIFEQSLQEIGLGDTEIEIYEEIKCVLAAYYYIYEQDTTGRMHWIADMGHGTLDVVCFTVSDQKDNVKINVLANSVEQNGIFYKTHKDFTKNITEQFFQIYKSLKKCRNQRWTPLLGPFTLKVKIDFVG